MKKHVHVLCMIATWPWLCFESIDKVSYERSQDSKHLSETKVNNEYIDVPEV